jgi:CheY-like chemotaxis protein
MSQFKEVNLMSKKALVVDNDFFFVEFLTELLEKRGYEVLKAYDGKEGLSGLEEGPFDVIFVDWIMPKIDGQQFIKFLRKKYPDSKSSIVFISSTVVEQLDDLKKTNADYYIAKGPIEEMAESIDKFMEDLEKRPFPERGEERVLEAGPLQARQVTGELMDRVNFYQGIIESVGVGVITVDKDARIMTANSRVFEILDKPIEEVLNRPITAVFPSREKARLIDIFKKIVRNRGLRRSILSLMYGEQKLRVTVSVLSIQDEISGWVLAMEETDEWVEQA